MQFFSLQFFIYITGPAKKLKMQGFPCIEAGISKNYSATNSGLPDVELRFCPWLTVYCSNIELGSMTRVLLYVPTMCTVYKFI
jgi:hypothetical protein